MPWGTTRQLLFALGALVLVGALGAGFYFGFIYAPPSCSDGRHNQNEEGVDCGGECSRLCVAPNVTALWARSVRVAPGVYHAVGLIKNPDTAAVGTVPYMVSLFDEENLLIATREGSLTLGPGEIAPLFEANVVVGERIPARTFIDVGVGVFERVVREPSSVRTLSWSFNEERTRLTATIENTAATPASGVTVTALLFDSTDVLIAASQTRIEVIDPSGRVDATFTWQEPFAEVPVRVDIIPQFQK